MTNYSERLNDDSLPSQQQIDFFYKIIFIITDGGGKEHLYQLFQQNLHLIDIRLIQILQIWYDDRASDRRIKFKKALVNIIFSLSSSMSQFSLGKRADNLEIAIAGYKIISNVCKEIGNLENWAIIQNHLGISYGYRILGNKKNNLETAISFHNNALKVRTKSDFPEEWASTQLNLGIAYIERIAGKREDNLERAISFNNAALTIFTEKDFPEGWALTKNSLGLVYVKRIVGDRRKNLELALASYNAALRVFTKKDFPQQWALLHSNIGNAYTPRIEGERKENIEKAIAAFTAAFSVRTETDFPEDWAATHMNLGVAFSDRIKGDRKENIELAIASYNAALRVYTEENFPQQWAMIQTNLGRAFSDRIEGERKENIEKAIVFYHAALKIRTEIDFPEDWALTQNNLGATYNIRIEGERKDNIEKAITAFTAALKVRSKIGFLQDWIMTQNNLGVSYSHRIEGKKSENIERAIACYSEISQVSVEADLPQDWAMAQCNLAGTYEDRISGERRENINSAIECSQNALTIYTPRLAPIECLATSRQLGNLHLNLGNWQLAIDAYITAIEAVEQSRDWASNDKNKQEVLSRAVEVYQNIIQAYINLKQFDKAIEYVERGKARNLVDLLATRDLYPKGEIPKQISLALNNLRQNIITEKKRSRQQNINNGFSSFLDEESRSSSGNLAQDSNADPSRLSSLYKSIDYLVTKYIHPIDPSFKLAQKVQNISFEKIKATLPTTKTALIEWYISKDTISAFIVVKNQSNPLHFHYSKKQYTTLKDSFVHYYALYTSKDPQWNGCLAELLAQLAQNLQLEKTIGQIKQLVPSCDRLILVPHRWLHLLPIHALPLSDGKCLLDLFPQGVSYAPSVQLLELTQKQNKPQLTNLFAVENPTEDPKLPFTKLEVTAIRAQFNPNDDVLIGKKGHKKALTKERLGRANCTHFSCHGVFNFENPELSALLLANSLVEETGEQSAAAEDKTRFLANRDGGRIDPEHCLTLGEIFGLDLRNCRLVTLSACETGLTDFKSLSDEYIGLPSGFLYAGSPSVVSSLWKVDDLSTTFLMIKFYQNLQAIDSVAIALNQAQLWLRDLTKEELAEWKKTLNIGYQMYRIDQLLINMPDNSRPFASPYHWAAFCAVGS